jgi:nucleotide-binding universal stress UspA family protein
VLRETIPARQPILTYYDGAEAATQALRTAVQLARRGGARPLTVLLPPLDDDETHRLRENVHALAPDLPLHVHALAPAEHRRLSAFARRTGGLVVLPTACAPLANVSLRQFLYEIDRPLLLTR